MNTNLNHGSATIYQFPVGGRSAIVGRRRDQNVSSGNFGSAGVTEVACSDSWYHEAAIQESRKGER